jgi:subtilisin family serine protease
LTKIEPFLHLQVDSWRKQSPPERAASGSDSPVVVFVRFTGDPMALRNAGLAIRSIVSEIAIGEVRLADVERLAALDQVLRIEGDRTAQLHLNVSVPQIEADVVHGAPLSLTGKGVIVGIVDTGIDIFHQNFLTADQKASRILSIWDQNKPDDKIPNGFATGHELTQGDIAEALKHPDTSYRGHDDKGHGSHVAGIAVGNGSRSGHCHGSNTFIGVAPEADLIIVKMTGSFADIIEGVKYIFKQADTLGKAAVVNLSLGWDRGAAHDGTSTHETVLDGLVGGPGRVIVVSAGNNADARLHVTKNVGAAGGANSEATLTMKVPASVDRFGACDIWYDGAAQLTLTLTPPNDSAFSDLNPGDIGNPLAGPSRTDTVTAQSTVNTAPYGRNHIYFSIAPKFGAVSAGLWTIRLRNTANAAATVSAWIQIPDPGKAHVEFDADYVVPGTITVPGTATHIITVGAYNPSKGLFSGTYDLADFSSHGPTLDGRHKPEICAPGVNITSAASDEAPHWFCCDCCLWGYSTLEGTSQAAPHVTGTAALMLQRNPALTYDQVRQLLQSSGRSPDHLTLPSNDDWGYGMVDAKTACEAVTPAALGGGGGGGGSAAPLGFPFAPTAVAHRGIGVRLRTLEEQFGNFPIWHELGALMSTHFDEVLRMIRRNRRVAVAWRRMQGPALVHQLLVQAGYRGQPVVLPSEVSDCTGQIDRMLTLLARYGSAALRSDVGRYRSLILALPTINVSDTTAPPLR